MSGTSELSEVEDRLENESIQDDRELDRAPAGTGRGDSGLHRPPNPEFRSLLLDARIRAAEKGIPIVPGSTRIHESRIPWAEVSDNPQPARYVEVPSAQARIEEHYAVHGLDDECLGLVNPPDEHLDDRQDNCGDCARAVAALLNGQPEAARPLLDHDPATGAIDRGEPASFMERAFGREGELDRTRHDADDDGQARAGAIDAQVARGFARLEDELLTAGDGAHAVVGVDWRPLPNTPPGGEPGGHWFNAANLDGEIHYLDGQRGLHCRHDDALVRQYQAGAVSVSWIRGEL